jgi:ubiquinone/menaquinone biosynthesis C-methylase UbiE
MNEFDLKAATWDENPMHKARSEAIAARIKDKIPLKSNMTALEFGAGTGTTGFILSGLLKEVVLVDSSPEMVKKTAEKIQASGIKNLKAVHAGEEYFEDSQQKFDLVFSQMVLHHIPDTESIINSFAGILNTGGYLAIADLYREDGSFHGKGFDGHNGFDPDELAKTLIKRGFVNVTHEKCFTIEKNISESEKGKFDVFVLTGQLSD